jgi:hypothetical protein
VYRVGAVQLQEHSMIVPTEGRIVWFRVDPRQGIPCREGKPNAAIVAAVNDDGTVNLTVFGSDGSQHSRENVTLVQDGPVQHGECTWMPYQRGQAAKVDVKEAELKAIRERGLVERPDGKGYDIAPAAETTQNPGQVADQNPAPAAAPAEQTQAQPTEPAPQG